MSDRELLELAADAMKSVGDPNFYNYDVVSDEAVCLELGCRRGAITSYWKPLTDDGDAFRLAVKIYMFDGSLFDLFLKFRLEEVLNDSGRSEEEIARRAIVRAAAEIGRNMK